MKPLRCHLGRCIGDEDGSVVTFGCIEKCGPGAVGEIAPRYDNSRDALVMKMTVEVGAVERRPARFKHDDLVRADLLSLSGEQRFEIKVNRARKQNVGDVGTVTVRSGHLGPGLNRCTPR